MAEAPGHLFVAKNKTIRLEMQQFCRVVARMSAMEDDLPALNALLSGLLVYVADQLDVLEEGVHAQIEIRERHVRNQLRAKVRWEWGRGASPRFLMCWLVCLICLYGRC